MNVVVVQPPLPAVSLEEAKRHLRVDWNDDDDLITAFVEAAQGHIDGPDGWLGRSIGVQTLEARFDVFRDAFPLPFGAILKIERVSYLGAAGIETNVLPSDYEVRGGLIGSAFGKRWPSVLRIEDAVRVRYVAGYGVSKTDASNEFEQATPAPIKAAILLMTADLYSNRESVSDVPKTAVAMPTTAERLLMPFRRWI